MRLRRGAGAAAQHILVGHEFAVVFTDGTWRRTVARIGCVGTLRPFPDITVQGSQGVRRRSTWMQFAGFDKVALHRRTSRGNLPFKLGRQPRRSPARVSIGFKVADVRDGARRVQRLQTF